MNEMTTMKQYRAFAITDEDLGMPFRIIVKEGPLEYRKYGILVSYTDTILNFAMFNSNASQNATVNRYTIDQVDAGIIKISRMVLTTDIQ